MRRTPDSEDWVEIHLRLIRGDDAALADLYGNLQEFRHLAEPPCGQKDFVQDLFLRLIVAFRRSEPAITPKTIRNLRAYCLKAARNLARDLGENAQRRRTLALPGSGDGIEGSSPAPGEVLSSREVRDAVRASLARLPSKDVEILNLRHLDGIRFRSLAVLMGRPGTPAQGEAVRSRLRKARERLRRHLQALGILPRLFGAKTLARRRN